MVAFLAGPKPSCWWKTNRRSGGRRRNFLTLQGYTVLEAKDGLDALTVARSYPSTIHLVVSDVVMPNMSGGQLATELAQVRPEIKLLFVSGYAGKTVLDHKVVDVETNFLQKPFTLKQLSLKVRSALGQGAHQPELEPHR